MPEVDDTYFYLLFAKSINTFIFFSCSWDATVLDIHTLLNFYNYSCPIWVLWWTKFYGTPFHLTKPPHTDLEALPEPNRANYDNSTWLKIFPNIPFKAAAKHANPEADEAIPEAVGNEFFDYTLKWYFSHSFTVNNCWYF